MRRVKMRVPRALLSDRCTVTTAAFAVVTIPTTTTSVRWNCVDFALHSRGFPTSLFKAPTAMQQNDSLATFANAVRRGENAVLVGAAGTGKRTALHTHATALASEGGRRVVITATRPQRCAQLGGVLLPSFLGLKPNAEAASVETAVASMARHVRSMNGSAFAHFMPCLTTCDVLVIDGLELVSPLTLEAFDIVAREERNDNRPFGGIQIIASANFWTMNATPSSPYVGNLFQMPSWNRLFPNQVPAWVNYKHESAATTMVTLRALFGALTDADIAALQKQPPGIDLLDEKTCIMTASPRFPKHPAAITEPRKKAAIRTTGFGQYLSQVLRPLASAQALGLQNRLHLEVGDVVALALPYHAPAGSGSGSLPAGAVGTVIEVLNHYINIMFTDGQAVSVSRLHCSVHHRNLPEIAFSVSQFPVFKAKFLCAAGLVGETTPPLVDSRISVDARVLTSPNDLGNLLSVVSQPPHITNLPEYLRREGFVHEPAKVYMETLLRSVAPSVAAEAGFGAQHDHWCKNCKAHIPFSEFGAHWAKCVQETRWCADCGCSVPSAKWEAHSEKHTVVMCIDCGRALEWKYWDQHRLSCGAMLRELSTENDFLPQSTKASAVEAVIDRNDLHAVKTISRSALPKSHKDVEQGPRVRAL